MTSLSQVQISPPADWQAFERASAVLWSHILDDQNLKRFGRNGQEQHGLDLTGYRNGNAGNLIGVQCKCLIRPKKLDEDTVRSEARKAAAYQPHLSEYIVTTTADDDAALDTFAHQLTEEFRRSGRNLIVRVFGWSSLQERIQQHPAARAAFDPDYSPVMDNLVQSTQEFQDLLPKVASEQAGQSQLLQDINRKLDALNHTTNRISLTGKYDHEELDRYRSLINNGQLSAALSLIRAKTLSLETDATPSVRSRLKALEAHCLWQQDKPIEAQKLFEQAFQLAPDEKKGIAASVYARVVVGDFEAGYDLALTAIRNDPENEAVVALLLMTAARTSNAPDPSPLIAEKLKNDVSYCEGYIDFLRNKSSGEAWWTYARKNAATSPESFIIQIAAADSQIDEFVTATDYKKTGRVPDEWRDRLNNAAETLSIKKENIEASENVRNPLLPSLVCNLALIWRILGDYKAEIATLKSAIAQFPDDPVLLERAAQATLDSHDPELENLCLSKLQFVGSQLLIRVLILSARGDWQSLASISSCSELATLDGSDGDMARLLVRIAQIKLSPKQQQSAAVQELLADDRIPREHLVAVSELAAKLGFDDFADQAFQIARTSIGPETHIAARLNFVRIAEKREDWRAVVSGLDGHVDTKQDTPELRLLARAFVNSYPVTERAIEFFEQIPVSLGSTRTYLEMRAIIALKCGDTESALTCITKALSLDPLSARLTVLKYQALRRANLLSECGALVEAINAEEFSGTTLEQMQLAHLLAMHGRREIALQRGYDLLMRHTPSPQVELLYCGLFLNWPETAETDPKAPDRVGDGCWVGTRDQHGQVDHFLIDSTLIPTREIVHLTDERAQRFLGLAVGDYITAGTGVLARTITVREIKHRYLHALHEVMNTFGDRYPDNPAMQKLIMQEGDIEPFLAMLRQRADEVSDIAERYKRDTLPIVLVGQLRASSPIDFMEFLEGQPFGIKTCVGTGEEREQATLTIDKLRNSGAALDLTALWTAVRLGCLDVIKLVFNEVSIPESAHAGIIQLRDEAKDKLKHKGGTAGFANGRYYLIEFKDDETRKLISRLESYLLQISKYTVVKPSVAPSDIDSKLLRLIVDSRTDDFLDAAFLARTDIKLLLSEDMVYRYLAGEIGARSSSWLQPVFAVALQAGLIKSERYEELIVGLAKMRHGYLSIDAKTLYGMAMRESSDLDAVASYIGTDGADIKSHISVVAEFADRALCSSEKPLKKGLSKLVARLVHFRPNQFATILAALIVNARDQSSMTKYLKWWCANRKLSFSKVSQKQLEVDRRLRDHHARKKVTTHAAH